MTRNVTKEIIFGVLFALFMSISAYYAVSLIPHYIMVIIIIIIGFILPIVFLIRSLFTLIQTNTKHYKVFVFWITYFSSTLFLLIFLQLLIFLLN